MWQALHAELEPKGLTVVTVALDFEPDKARPFIEAVMPTHPSLIDSQHRIDELFGIANVPMAVWIDESGTLVRPAETASAEPSKYAGVEITENMPERMQQVLSELKNVPDIGEAYRSAIVDWVEKGSESRYALSPDALVQASQPRSANQSRAAACFELGRHLYENGDKDAAIIRWKQAHVLYPENWTYKRQAWTLESTPEGAKSDRAQEVQEVYGTSWSDEFLQTGGANYGILPQL